MASGIDVSGTVVGMSGSTAVLWRPGSANGESILGDAGSGQSPHISSGGTIVLDDPTPQSSASQHNHFVVKDGVIQQSVSQIGRADAVDDAGDYIGVAARGDLYPPGIIHYADGRIGYFGGRGTYVAGMNNHGMVVSNAGLSGSDPTFRPMLYDGSTQTVLSTDNEGFNYVFQINDAGWIIGNLLVAPTEVRTALMVGRGVAPFQSLLADQSLSVQGIILSNGDRVFAKVRDTDGSRFVILMPANVE
jgi:hypothetical protein